MNFQSPQRKAVKLSSVRTYKCPKCDEGSRVAAFVLAEDGETVIGRFPRVEDAQLDAAAPRMLEALKYFVGQCEASCTRRDTRAYLLAKAAIAEAERAAS